jgi:hypothetical protein
MAAIAGSPNRRLSFMVMTGFLKGIGDFHITSLSWPPPAFSDFAEPSTLYSGNRPAIATLRVTPSRVRQLAGRNLAA